MTAMTESGKAVQILNLVEDTHELQEGRRLLKLDTQVLKDIVGKAEDHSLAIIVITGPERQGKSFILSYFVRYLQALENSATGAAGDWMERGQPSISMKYQGFAFENSFERTTEGMWMWSRPFFIPQASQPKKKLAVLLMDTEGCYGSSLSNQEQTAILGLSLLTSSVFIYNETTRINDNTITTVGKFMEYGQLAAQSFHSRMFQRIMFLVRDWNRPDIFEYGAAGGQSYIREFFRNKPRMSKEAMKQRKAIVNHFEDLNAYLMPHPGEQAMSDQFTGSVGEMKPEFAHHVEVFVANLIAEVAPKKVNNEFLSGSQFVKLFHRYVMAFNRSDMPNPASIIEASQFIAFESQIMGLTQSVDQALTVKIEEQKIELRRMLRDVQGQAEENMEKAKQDVMVLLRTEVSNALEGLARAGALAEREELQTSVAESTNIENRLQNGHQPKKDVLKRKLPDDVDAEHVKEARRKVMHEMNNEYQAARHAMDTVLSCFALQTNAVLQRGKYITIQKLEMQLDNDLRDSLESLKGLLLSKQVSTEIHLEGMNEKLKQKKRDLLQRDGENFETILEQVGEIVHRRYQDSSWLRSYMESEAFRLEVEAELTEYLKEKCEGDCDQDLKNRAIEKVNDQHNRFMTKIEASEKILELVTDAVKYYNDSMENCLLGIMPAHPADIFHYHQWSTREALRKIRTNGGFITRTLETQVTTAVKLAYKTWMEKNNLEGGEDNTAIGIDLGTTTCCIAIHRMGETRILKDRSRRSLTPSLVFIGEDESAVVGHEADDQANIHPEDTVFDAKRLVGRKFTDLKVQSDLKTWPFKVVEDPVTQEARLSVRGKSYRPEEILAMQIRCMKNIAEEVLAEPVKKAVITVPANFNDRQRDATRQAAQIADVEVLQLINEPTAAVMAYAADWKAGNKTILVFDFGGGTLDVTILRAGKEQVTPVEEGAEPTSRVMAMEAEDTTTELNVVTTVGDMHLGGQDFDNNLVKFCARKFEEKEGIDLFKPENSNAEGEVKRRLRRLRNACEAAKVRLSHAEASTAYVRDIIQGIDLQVHVTRKEFEEMNEELFQKAIQLVGEALKEAKLSKEDIDEALMVGRSSLIPCLRQRLQQFLDKPSLKNHRSGIEESVAIGAAIQACIIAGGSNVKCLPKVKARDVQPFSLGIRLRTGELSVIVPRNTSIPAKRTEKYILIPAYDHASTGFRVYSGEDPVADSDRNTLVDRFTLKGVQAAKEGKQIVAFTMEIDASGILHLTAVLLSKGGMKNLVFEDKSGRLSEQQIVELRSRFQCTGALQCSSNRGGI